MSQPKVLILATEGLTTTLLYNSLSTYIEPTIFIEKKESKWHVLKRRVKRLGVSKTSGQVLFMVFALPFIPSKKNRIEQLICEFNLSAKALPEAALKSISSVNDPEVIAEILKIKPDLIVINGTRILSTHLLDKIQCPIVNIHVGITPQYRGVHGGFWALKDNNPALYGVTLHYVDKGIDTGRIIAQKTLIPSPIDNFKTYPIQQYAAGIALLNANLEAVIARAAFDAPILTEKSLLHYHPTLMEYLTR